MNDPSYGINPVLLNHVHLVSTYRWPTLSTVSINTIVENLLHAPKITKELASMNWLFLDAPPDGTVILVWQPLAQLGTRFATDGYVWADPEQFVSQEYQGYVLEMYLHKSGYHPSHQATSTHSRRRYRLVPGPTLNPNQPQCDPALWIVHYTKADQAYQIPVARLAVNMQTQQMLQQRRAIQSQGPLIRKEFMLEDKVNWPHINLPQQRQHMAGYPGNVISHMNRSQQQAYLQDSHAAANHQHIGPSPAKRPRQNAPAQRPGSSPAPVPGANSLYQSNEEEDDYTRGDYLDMITPREISINRFKTHHEWLEEIYASAYANGQIMPVELGLGRKGELESLTRGFFEAPIGGTPISKPKEEISEPPPEAKYPGLGLDKAEEFTKRATEKIAEINAEMEKMKELHARRMAKIRQGSILRDVEKRLRSAVVDPKESGIENPIPPSETDIMVAGIRQQGRIDEIAGEVERALHRKIDVVHEIKCVQKGGLEEKALLESGQINNAIPPTSTDVMLDASITMPAQPDDVPSFPDFDEKADWMQADPDADPVPDNLDIGDTPLPDTNNVETSEPATNLEPQNQNGDAGDWVMVDRQDDSANAAAGGTSQLNHLDVIAGDQTDLDKLGSELPDFSTDVPDLNAEGFEGNDFDDTVDFSNLDTAGEALAGYEPNDGMDTDEHVGLLDDSAFGDAFHHTDANMEGNGEEGSV
ncbi:hypothetical protein MMC30_005992 [Trapelia coarctata]|nr:hypothetical protein [Trapelia coarctata]